LVARRIPLRIHCPCVGPARGRTPGEAREGLKLLWFATGSADFLLDRTKESVALSKRHGYAPVFNPTTGGHTWINWQKYLNEFAPQLFR
jgi:enterochelin esterase family protein